MTSLCDTHVDITKTLKNIVEFSNASNQVLANTINTASLATMNSFQPLPHNALSNYSLTDSFFLSFLMPSTKNSHRWIQGKFMVQMEFRPGY